MIYCYKRKKELENLYENNPNELCKMFIDFGFEEDKIIDMFKNQSKEEIINILMNLLRLEQFDTKIDEYYFIPEKYKKWDIDFLKQDIEDDYNEMNNSIDKKVGEILSALYDEGEDKYIIGIHRTSNLPQEVFEKGIKMREEYLIDNVQTMFNFCFMLREIKLCEDYKFSRGCYIVKIPKKFVKGNLENAEPIFYVSEDKDTYLRPEFVVAYVPVLHRRIGMPEMNDYPRKYYKKDTEFRYNDDIDIKSSKSYGFINIALISVITVLTAFFVFLILK